jgi:EmrB/QacA subfamily drug resistance transporter
MFKAIVPMRAGAPGLRAVLAIIVCSYLMVVIDISIVLTGLPKIQESLRFTPTNLSWVQNAYTLVFGGLLLLGARMGDIAGRRRMFVAGLALFTLASLAIGLAQSPAWLIGARAVQGVGAAILTPSTLALLSTHFPEGPARTRALSYYAAAAGVGASIGLVLGGLVADLVSWRLGFFINLPIGIALIVAARRCIAETPLRAGRFDLPGALTSTAGMGALVFGIVRAAEQGWGDPVTLASVASGLLLLAVFVWNESRAAQPILPLRLFASPERAAAYAARLLFLGGMVGFWFFMTQYLQQVLGMRPLHAGLAFLPTTIPNFVAAMMVPVLTRKLGHGRLLAIGLVAGIAGMAWLGQVSEDTGYLTGIALPMILVGAGQGAVLAPLTVAAVAGVTGEDAGAASGVVNVAHQLGSSLGLAVLVVVFASSAPAASAAGNDLAHRIGSTFQASTLMLVLALLLAVGFIVRGGSRRSSPAAWAGESRGRLYPISPLISVSEPVALVLPLPTAGTDIPGSAPAYGLASRWVSAARGTVPTRINSRRFLMQASTLSRTAVLAFVAAAAVSLTACGKGGSDSASGSSGSSGSAAQSGGSSSGSTGAMGASGSPSSSKSGSSSSGNSGSSSTKSSNPSSSGTTTK